MTVSMWILTTAVTVLLAVVAFFLKRLIDNIDKLNITITGFGANLMLYNLKTEQNEAKNTYLSAEIINVKERLTVIETEHKNRKCK